MFILFLLIDYFLVVEINMYKSWLNVRDRRYIIGIDNFLNWAFNQPNINTVIRCPCNGCRNTAFKQRIQVRRDLLGKGFWDSYNVWDLHGEVLARVDPNNICNDEEEGGSAKEDDIVEMIHDTYGYANMKNINNIQEDNEQPNVYAKKFYKLLEDAEIELYPCCKNMS